jgi:hypothetical protein
MRRILISLLSVLVLASCQDDAKRMAEIERGRKHKEAVFSQIDRAWIFNARPINPTAAALESNWTAWRVFLNEFSQKPKSTIGAFRSKARTLSARADQLNDNIPGQFNRPEIRSRIAVLQTKVNALDLFLNLDAIPADKAVAAIADINAEMTALQLQLDEIVRRSQIPKEEGEDFIRMRDTSRAIPDKPAVSMPKPASHNPHLSFLKLHGAKPDKR